MKKILLSIGAMIVLLQFSNAVQASQTRYIIQDKPVTFFETKSVETIEDKKEVQEVKSTPETSVVQEEKVTEKVTNKIKDKIKEKTSAVKNKIYSEKQENNLKNIEQKQPLVEEKQVVEKEPVAEEKQPEEIVEKTTVENNQTVEENQPVQEEQKFDEENQQSEFEQNNFDEKEISNDVPQSDNNFIVLKNVKIKEIDNDKVVPASPEAVEKFKEVFDKNLDNASVIVDNSDIIALKGLFMMYKAIFDTNEQVTQYEKTISELETMPINEEKVEKILDVKRNMIDEICGTMETFDFSSLPQERKYMWGQGSYILIIGHNRTENVAVDLAPYYQLVAIGKIDPKDVKPQLEKSSALILRIKNILELQGGGVATACRVNDENQIKVTIPENEMTRPYKAGLIVPYQDQLWDIHQAGQMYVENVVSKLGNLIVQPKDVNGENEHNKFYVIKESLISTQKLLENDPNYKLTADQKEMIKALPIDTATLANMYLQFLKGANKFKNKILRDKLLKNTVIIEFETLQNLISDSRLQGQDLKDIITISKNLQQKLK